MTNRDREDEPPRLSMAHADLLTAIVLLVLGIAMLYGGYTMDRLEIRQIHPASIPGLVPMALGATLAVAALALLAGAVRAGGARLSPAAIRRSASAGPAVRLLLALALTVAYPLGLVGTMPFWAATAIFATLFIAVFEWRARPLAGHAVALATAALQGVLVGAVTATVFQELFLVRLP